MLVSSAEYLQALRKGDYLRFLEWPDFVVAHYKKGNAVLGGDELADLLVFEWLNNNYCAEDAKQFALLYAASEDEAEPLRGKLSCALTTLFSVCIACMAYEDSHATAHFLSKEARDLAQISRMMRNNGGLTNEQFTKHSAASQEIFMSWVAQLDKNKVSIVAAEISEVTRLRYLIDDYRLELLTLVSSNDQLKSSRSSVAANFSDYMSEQMKMTPEVNEGVAGYVTKLWELAPSTKEQDLLKKMAETTIWDKACRYLATFSSLFSTLELLPPSHETKAKQAENNPSV